VEKIRSDSSFKGAYTSTKEVARFLNKRRNVRKLKICKETVMMIPIVIYMRQDFCLLNAIDKTLKNVKPSGLIDFWGSNDVERDDYTKETFYPKALDLLDLSGSFYILLLGWLFCLFAFLLEIGFFLLQSWKKDKTGVKIEEKQLNKLESQPIITFKM
jgi:hypothetical protein